MRSRRFFIFAGVLLLCGAIPLGLWFATADSRRAAREVQEAVTGMIDPVSEASHQAASRLVALGPKAYPELRRILARPVRHRFQFYPRLWTIMPEWVRRQWPDPNARANLRGNLEQSLEEAGPVICRAMTGAVCGCFERNETHGNEMGMLRVLIWSIPESRRAVATLSNYVARPTNSFLFGSVYANDLWSEVPELASALAQWLRNEHAINDAARGLAALGPKAAFAVPMLVDVAENGVASPRITPAIRVSYGAGVDINRLRRRVAVEALGKIGVTNDLVMGALARAAESGDNELCFKAAIACAELGVTLPEPLEDWLEKWNPFAETPGGLYMASEALRELGKVVNNGSVALQIIIPVASGRGVETAGQRNHFNQFEADALRVSAISALFKIDRKRASEFFPYVLEQATNANNWQATDLLRQWNEKREEIIPVVTPLLDNPKESLRGAYILYNLATNSSRPKEIMAAALQSTNVPTRGMAVNWFWNVSQDASQVLPVARELLGVKEEDDFNVQTALNVLEKMGEQARPAIPELKRLLESPSWGARDRAGRLLRKLAPEEMPPIID